MHIDYKATIWFRIPIEQREVLDKCIDILMSGGTINDLYNDIDENDIGPCEILYDTEEQISPQENQDNPTIEAHIDKEGTMDTEIIWQNFDYYVDISPNDTVNQETTDGTYLRAYKLYLQEYDIDDDSHETTEEEAKDYLLDQMEQEDIDELLTRSA